MKIVTLVLWALPAFAQSIPMPGPGMPVSAVSGGGGGGGGTCTPVSGYGHCRVLTISHTQVGATLTNFPVLVSTTLGSSRIESPNCYDVVFTSDSGGTAEIPWEQETCVESTGAIVDWVVVSSISSSADTNIYVSYDNASINAAQNTGAYSPANVWDNYYKAVWHLGSGNLTADSTNNTYNLTNTGSVSSTSGQIGGGALLSGSNHLDGPTIPSIGGASQLTLSFWINPSSVTPYAGIVSAWSGTGLFCEIAGGGKLNCNLGGGVQPTEITATLSVGTWGYYTFVFDGTQPNNFRWTEYLNGVPAPTNVVTGGLSIPVSLGASTGPFLIAPLDGYRFAGAYDEVRISTGVARSPAWIAAEYANQAGSTFLTIGSEI